MPRTLPDAIRELLLALPGVEEKSSHGMPGFKVAGKNFAYFVLNHHGDGRVALWLGVPKGSQRLYTEVNPKAYFVPPYVGPKGWLGMELNKGLAWQEVMARVQEAHAKHAPKELGAGLPDRLDVAPPEVEMTPEDINPLLGEYPQQVLAEMAERCRRLPETTRRDAAGSGIWQAGKKTFVRAVHRDGRMRLMFWVGAAQQALLTEDPRYSIPMYYGGNGWIELDVQDHLHWEEIESLLLGSYRHFALKRMLRALEA